MGALGSKPKTVVAQQSPFRTQSSNTQVQPLDPSEGTRFANSIDPSLQKLNEELEQTIKQMKDLIANDELVKANAVSSSFADKLQMELIKEQFEVKYSKYCPTKNVRGGNKSQAKRKLTTKNKKSTPKKRSNNKK